MINLTIFKKLYKVNERKHDRMKYFSLHFN